MNLSTEYLGLKLKNPLMPGASPLADNLDTARQLEDAGAAAIVMHSLFEEQITLERQERVRHIAMHTESFAEALTYLPEMDEFSHTPDDYLDHLARLKAAVGIPVIASLNGLTRADGSNTRGKWSRPGRTPWNSIFTSPPTP